MGTIVLDIEAAPALTRYADSYHRLKAMAERRRDSDVDSFVALSPPMTRLTAVGMLNYEKGTTMVLLNEAHFDHFPFGEMPEWIVGVGGEDALLRRVYDLTNTAARLVTFNGRGFDLPALIHRAIANGLRVDPYSLIYRAANEYRFKPNAHIDLSEIFTFFGATQRQPLEAYCLGYGIPNPKAHGGGEHAAELTPLQLAEYCIGDVMATAELYRRWMAATATASAPAARSQEELGF